MNDEQFREMTLEDRYIVEDGEVYLTGTQALLRVLLDQRRADRRVGLNTAGFVSGYPGSPLGGLDQEFNRQRELMALENVVHVPGLNEDLAATAVFGSQTVTSMPGALVDGVFAMWYGKAPGVDRSGDAFRHANIRGVARHGGILAVAGDDPDARSSMIPTDSNQTFYDWSMPILFPGNVQDVLDLGLHGFALSRASGLLVGFKTVTNVADGAGTARVSPTRINPQLPNIIVNGSEFKPDLRLNVAGPPMKEAEYELAVGKLEIAREYIRLNNVNELVTDPSNARIGLIAGGTTYYELRRALDQLGLDDEHLARAGIRLMKLGAIYPLSRDQMISFAHGLKEIIVVEDKRSFIELFLKEMLYGRTGAPAIVGKMTPESEGFFPPEGELIADVIRRPLGERLSRNWNIEHVAEEVARHATPKRIPLNISLSRTSFFCSGCPHNRSLIAPEGAVVGAGIGCHIMALTVPRDEYGTIAGYTQMGAEGTQWIGMAPFTETNHIYQNLGDGTFHHSGSLAIRFAVASKVNITYKLLYNSAVGMTGGQDVQGAMPVPQLVSMLAAEGVKKIIVTTDDLKKYRHVPLSKISEVWHRDRMIEAQEELAGVAGVTVLIHDQQCAAEKRRLRKRSKQEEPTKRVFINERVCEGCGDCGKKSQCLSVQPIETEFGRKTKIHQSSCNLDYSCLLGDCPSFMTVETKDARPKVPIGLSTSLPELPAPSMNMNWESFSIQMAGIGGTGVVTVSQILATAATIEGLHVRDLDLTGSSQKAGPVVSQLQFFKAYNASAATIATGEVDLLLGFDLLTSVNQTNLDKLTPLRTTAVVSTSQTPTGRMSIDPSTAFPERFSLISAIEEVSRADQDIFIGASEIAESLFGTHMAANMVLVGAALQAGALPLSIDSVKQAIRLNGTSVEANLAALHWGRVAVSNPGGLPSPTAVINKSLNKRLENADLLLRNLVAPAELIEVLRIRLSDLIAYQGLRYAKWYLQQIRSALEHMPDAAANSESVVIFAKSLFKFAAYKDEYEVARLLMDSSSKRAVIDQFGPGAKIRWNLHPPVLRSLGMKQKIQLAPWAAPAFKTLVTMRHVRGTIFDPFGRTHIRRIERALLNQYLAMMLTAFEKLPSLDRNVLNELAETPEIVRGYEEVKLSNVRTYLSRISTLCKILDVPTFIEGILTELKVDENEDDALSNYATQNSKGVLNGSEQ